MIGLLRYSHPACLRLSQSLFGRVPLCVLNDLGKIRTQSATGQGIRTWITQSGRRNRRWPLTVIRFAGNEHLPPENRRRLAR